MAAPVPTHKACAAKRPHPLRRRVLGLLVSLVGLAALAPAPAHAAGDLQGAIRVANTVFPSVPQRCGAVAIEIGPLSASNAGASAESFFRLCKVRYAPETLPKASNAQLCSLTIHEWGHLAGLSHSSDPNSIMHPTVPHHPACGPPDAAATAIDELTSRREAIADKLSDLRAALREARRAHRRVRGARKAVLARRVKRLKSRITRLKAQYRALS